MGMQEYNYESLVIDDAALEAIGVDIKGFSKKLLALGVTDEGFTEYLRYEALEVGTEDTLELLSLGPEEAARFIGTEAEPLAQMLLEGDAYALSILGTLESKQDICREVERLIADHTSEIREKTGFNTIEIQAVSTDGYGGDLEASYVIDFNEAYTVSPLVKSLGERSGVETPMTTVNWTEWG